MTTKHKRACLQSSYQKYIICICRLAGDKRAGMILIPSKLLVFTAVEPRCMLGCRVRILP